MIKDGVRMALGFGRGGRAKTLPWFFIALLSALGLVFAMVAGAAERMGGPGAAEQMNLPTHSDFYGIASFILYMFAAVVAPELLCRDRRDGVVQLYLVRPLTVADYVFSRWVACFLVMFAAAVTPQVILFIGLSMGDPAPLTYLQKHWLDAPKFLLAGAAMAAYVTTLALLTASFTKRPNVASVFLIGLVSILTPFTIGLASEIGGTFGQWLSMFTLTAIPVHVNDVIFGKLSEVTSELPSRTVPDWIKVGWWFLWTVVPGAVLWWRYRRLTA